MSWLTLRSTRRRGRDQTGAVVTRSSASGGASRPHRRTRARSMRRTGSRVPMASSTGRAGSRGTRRDL